MSNVTKVATKTVQATDEFQVPQDRWAYAYFGMVMVLVLGAVGALVVPFFGN